ncbi:26469_t:CDS:1, partial [Racocetra persica]
TLPAYLQVSQEVCQRCYNRLMQSSVVMKKHAKVTYNIQPLDTDALDLDVNMLDPKVNTLDLEVNTLDLEVISFLMAIKIMTNILYKREVTKKLLIFQTFEEFRAYMELENKN